MMKKNKLWQRIAALAVLGTAFALGGYGLTAEAAAQQAAGTNGGKERRTAKGGRIVASDNGMGQDVPGEQGSKPPEGHLPQPLRH